MNFVPKRFVLAAASVVALAIAACGTGQGTSSPPTDTPSVGPTTIEVTLQEWAVVPASVSVPAGDVTFQVTNSGPADLHEFVVLKTDLEHRALPVDANGAVTEAGGGMEVVKEVENVAVGTTQELIVSLAAGKYVLLCNIYDETEKEAHYAKGMSIAFTVAG